MASGRCGAPGRGGRAEASRVPGPGLGGRAGPVGGFSPAGGGRPFLVGPRQRGASAPGGVPRVGPGGVADPPGGEGARGAGGVPGSSPCTSPDSVSRRSSKRVCSPCVWRQLQFGDRGLPCAPQSLSCSHCRSCVLIAITKFKEKFAVGAV